MVIPSFHLGIIQNIHSKIALSHDTMKNDCS